MQPVPVVGTEALSGIDHILLVEDDPSLTMIYKAYLRDVHGTVTTVGTAAAARAAVTERPPALVLLDLVLPDGNGMQLLQEGAFGKTPVVVLTANGSINAAVEAIRQGARDFLVKPFSAERLLVTIGNVLRQSRLERIVQEVAPDGGDGSFEGFVGRSSAMRAVYRTIDTIAKSRATVFITGESGTGKELCAEAIHRRSPRRSGPFVPLNCGAIPRELIESELFGHVRGAFTGAAQAREGAAARAAGGTLFLDEICEMDPVLQTKLLRFLQTGSYQPVGSDHPVRADVRILCATNRNPETEVAEGRFREDLFYRLYVVPIELPPLRDREDDVLLIARHLLVQFAREDGTAARRLTAEAEQRLQAQRWPGNVRQLQNLMRRAVLLHEETDLTPAMLGLDEARREPSASQPPQDEIRPLWEVERDTIEEAVRRCGGNVTLAAAKLGISASKIYRKRQEWYGSSAV